MNPETFFDKFGLLADTPNGVQKLRELILQLAVQGKLVPQDLNDEPAAVLLERIKAEKARLIKEKKIKVTKALPPIKGDEWPYELPKEWKLVRLGELVESMTNGIYKPSKYYSDNGIACLRMYNIQKGKINYLNLKRMLLDDNEIEQYHLVSGDLLVNRVNSRELVGKAGVINLLEEPLIFESKNIRVRFIICEELPEYINILFQTREVREVFEGDAKQTCGQASISQPQVAGIITPLPPLNEQKRIVAKVDQLMALCDELEARQQKKQEARLHLNSAALDKLLTAHEPDEFAHHWQRVYDNFDLLYGAPETVGELRKAILQLAVRGKLVRQDANDEPAAVLLERIRAEKERLVKEKKIKKTKPLPPIKSNEIPYEIPNIWILVRLEETTTNVEYGTSQKSSTSNIGVPTLRMNNINNGKIFYNNMKYIYRATKDLPRLFLKYNDILFNRTNSYELVGKTGVFKGENDTFTFASYLIRVSLLLGYVDSDFLNFVMNSTYFRKTQIEPEITQQCGQANFNGTKLKNTIIPLPPLAEQRRIVAKVDQLMALCDELESKLKQSQTDGTKLMDAVVHQLVEA